nr:nucleolin-like [Aegilops tauschii subsp. strangulata]
MSKTSIAPGQEADPSSIRRSEDFPKEWAKRKAKLAKMAKEAGKKFNEDSAAAATEASASKPKKTEIKAVSDEFNAYRADWLDTKAVEETESTRAAEEIPAPKEIARATSIVAPEDQTRPDEAFATPEDSKHARATASAVPKETKPISSAPPAKSSQMKNINLPSASKAQKTKATEKAAVKKRKASATTKSSAPKNVKTLTSSYTNPIDVVLISSMPSKEIVPFGEEYVIRDDIDEEHPPAASSEQFDEDIEVDDIPSTPPVSSTVPQFIADEAGVEEIDEEDEDVDIGSTTPVLNDDYWERLHPNSPLTTPLHQIPQSPVQTEEIHTGSEGHQASLRSIPEEVPATNAKEMETKTADDETAAEIPQSMAPEVVRQEAVKTSTVNLQPKPQNPHTKKQKFKVDDFFAEHYFFTDYNPYDSTRLRGKRFRTASQMNFYSSLLFDKDKLFEHQQILHVNMESLPCFTPVLSVLHDAGLLNLCTDICD